MTVERFQEIANKTLAEYTKDKEEKYGWTAWWPPHTHDVTTVLFDYRATLWEGEEDRLIDTMLMPKDLSEEEAVTHTTKWLKENLRPW